MSKKINSNEMSAEERLSALLDDDLQDKDVESLIDQVLSEDEQHQRWYRYNMIGAVMNKEHSAYSSYDFTQSVAAKIALERAIISIGDGRSSVVKGKAEVISLFKRTASGFALAASVAYAVVFSVQMLETGPSSDISNIETATVETAPDALQYPSYSVSEAEAMEQAKLDEIQKILDNMGRRGLKAYEQQVGGEWIISTKIPQTQLGSLQQQLEIEEKNPKQEK